MTRRRPQPIANPVFAWAQLALTAAEMMAASAQVINHRTRRRNSPAQLFAMANEKAQATVESSHAMARHWLAMAPDGLQAWEQWARLFSIGLAPYHARAMRNARRVRRR